MGSSVRRIGLAALGVAVGAFVAIPAFAVHPPHAPGRQVNTVGKVVTVKGPFKTIRVRVDPRHQVLHIKHTQVFRVTHRVWSKVPIPHK